MRRTSRCTMMLALLALGLGAGACKSSDSYQRAPSDPYGYGYDAVAPTDAPMEAALDELDASSMTPTVSTTSTPPTSAPAMPSAVMGSVPSGAAATAEPSTGAETAIADAELPTTGADAVDQMLVFNGALSLMVDADGTAAGIDAAVDHAVRAGGYISQQTDTSLVLRVPSRRFRKLMHQIEALGDVRSRSVQTVDVSEEFHDLAVRLDNLKATRIRIQKLLGEAKDLGQILVVEKELERIGGEIDRIEGRLRFLSSQAAFSTVTITFSERPREVPVLADDGHVAPPPPPPPPHLLDTPVGWIDEVGVHGLMRLR